MPSPQLLRRHLSHWLDESISDEELHQLQETLASDKEARLEYFSFMQLHASLHDSATARDHLVGLLACSVEDEKTPQTLPWGLGKTTMMAVTSVAIAASLLVGLWITHLQKDNNRLAANQSRLNTVSAQVVHETTDCRWFVEHEGVAQSPSLTSGDTIRVSAGKLKLRYLNGVELLLHAPAAFLLVSDMQAKMILGRLTAVVPEAGHGFTVLTPQATVIDLGTEFGVDVGNGGATDVVVFKGEVDVDYRQLQELSADGVVNSPKAHRLHMGEAVRFDAEGTASRIVSITQQHFAEDSLIDSTLIDRPQLITAVSDNILREELWNYYEIVHGGMAEDALAFADREAHEYNGVDSSGMPAYLLGGDYVKTFNNDKVSNKIRIQVALSGPAKLYVLLDNRIEPPAWLSECFSDTGDDIGIDGGPFQSKGTWHNKGPAGIGPGVSIEDTLSVWVQEVPEAGVVQLGAVNVSKEWGANMYGIVAVPL